MPPAIIVNANPTQGPPGNPGTNGTNAFTTTAANFAQPAVNGNVQLTVGSTSPFAAGQNAYVATGGYYKVISIDSSILMTVQNLGYTGNAAPAAVITNPQLVTAAGLKGDTGAAGGWLRGTFAARPAAPTVDTNYDASDGHTQWLYDFAAGVWRPRINGIAWGLQPSAAANWTGVNISAPPKIADSNGALLFTGETFTSVQYKGYFVAGTTEAACAFVDVSPPPGSTVASMFSFHGAALRESATGKLCTFGFVRNWNNAAPTFSLEWNRYTATGTRVETVGFDYVPQPNGPMLVRVAVVGNNVLAQYATWAKDDSVEWTTFNSIAKATAFTTAPDQVGVSTMTLNCNNIVYLVGSIMQ